MNPKGFFFLIILCDKINLGGFMQLKINDDIIDVIIVRKANKNIYMRFKEDKKLYVTCNSFVSVKDIKKIIEKNKNKIAKMYEVCTKENEKDLFFQYLGKQYTIIYDDCVKEIYFDKDMIITKDKKMLDKFYIDECFRVFIAEMNRIVEYFDNIPRFTLKIRKMKTRWGVNNLTKKTITLNSELLKKDIDLLDYVIIHELCHFYEANHSKAFWNHVTNFYPNYKEARKRLRS